MLPQTEVKLPDQERRFVPEDFELQDWPSVQPYYQDLLDREVNTVEALYQWLRDRSELETIVSEAAGWKYINKSRDTANESYKEDYETFVREVAPHIQKMDHRLNKKLLELPQLDQLEGPAYDIMLKRIKRQVELFREENVELKTEESLKRQRYGEVMGEMTIEWEGEQLTLPQAKKELQSTDRDKREKIYRKVQATRLAKSDNLNSIFDELLSLRHQMAQNADYDNYRDYKFDALERFDYEVEDCFDFHASVKNQILPLVDQLLQKRRAELGVERLRPWDLSVDPTGQPPLRPFDDTSTLIKKSITCFNNVHPLFGQCLQQMKDLDHFDLETRQNKAPGGFNYPLYETGAPFIFTNAAGTVSDVITMMHEGGHAVHSFLTNHLRLLDFKDLTAEVAELASMSMELFTMQHWEVFFDNENDLKRAQFKELERVLHVLPWIATIDKFQHWLYTHPEHTLEERTEAWRSIAGEFTPDTIDWSGLTEAFDHRWQGQLHLFEVPFYYIEYGIAQLGAIGMWQQYEKDQQQALHNYIKALRLGYTCSIPEIYKTAGIQFNFSENYIKELADFIQKKISEF